MIGVAAVVANPLAVNGYVEDLSSDINRMTMLLGKLLKERLIALAGSGEALEAYGKACIAGENFDWEHAYALTRGCIIENSTVKWWRKKLPRFNQYPRSCQYADTNSFCGQT